MPARFLPDITLTWFNLCTANPEHPYLSLFTPYHVAQLSSSTQSTAMAMVNSLLDATAVGSAVTMSPTAAGNALGVVTGVTQHKTTQASAARRRLHAAMRQLYAPLPDGDVVGGSDSFDTAHPVYRRRLVALEHARRRLDEAEADARNATAAGLDAISSMSTAVLRGAAPGEKSTVLSSPQVTLALSRLDPTTLGSSSAQVRGDFSDERGWRAGRGVDGGCAMSLFSL